MAGLQGNVAWVLAQKQTVKGTPGTIAVATSIKNPLSGGSIGPSRQTDNLSETDATRDRGNTFIQQTAAEGSPEVYVRDGSIGHWLYYALGADAPTGSMPNFTHAITPANVLPYVTVWRNIADTLWEQYLDCKVGSISISADTGGPLTATLGIMGRSSTRLTVTPDNATPITIQSGPVYNFNDVTGAVTLSGGATALVSSFELTIENNLSLQQTDSSIPYDVVEGTREISLGFDMIFADLTEYNKFHYGGAAGTTQASTTYTTSAVFTFTKSANNSIAFNLPVIAYEEFPVEPNAGGDPIVVSVRAAAQRNSPIITATVKNQVAAF
jgi:hypothetical protein